ncbi:hypothetical protein DLJ46_26880 [Micromonospora globispora]|uniref:Uncharacterized protein n=1 Tax=Micromonospora globispora TaxID=1450148 RepID=A0A317JXL6_9ACTN|nr:hypothetical protein DLJ46_26880 [Micromonospora globispora]RQX03186.1 hypothetical protein DKL51_04280 [Micromonospora globispora]
MAARQPPILATVVAEWTGSDAWVFSSIEGTGPDDGYALAQIIAKADRINHALLTEAEFIQAVPRLIAAGLIGAQAEADRYWQTEAGRALYQQGMKGRGLFGWMEAIPPALHRLRRPQDTAWSLPAGVFDRATQDWHERARALLKRHGGGRREQG